MTRRDLTRRSLLDAAVGAATGFAGCMGLSDRDGGIDDDRLAALAGDERLRKPDQFPFRITEDLLATHTERARALLDAVPPDPDVPNELVADDIASDRASLAEELEALQVSPAEGDGSASPRRQLRDLRDLRTRAAELSGSYRAATTAITDADVRRRRDRLRDRLASFRTAWAYRGSNPVDALVSNCELERRVNGIEHDLEPWPPFPASPVADIDPVRHLVGKLESAAASLDEVERFRQQQPGDGPGYRPAMFATTTWLRRRAQREASHEPAVERGRDAIDRDLEGTVAGIVFDTAHRTVEGHTNRDLQAMTEASRIAEAVCFAGTRRAAVSTFAGLVADIEAGDADRDVTVPAVRSARTGARDAVTATQRDGTEGVVGPLLEPAYRALHDGEQALERGDGVAALGRFAFAKRFAGRVADGADELAFLLRTAAKQ